jgi:hypothetical protein
MPTVLRERGFRVMIFLNDHPPPHVHVLKAGKRARVYLSPVELLDSNMKASDEKRAIETVQANHDTLMAEWYRIHGDEEN